MMDISKFIYYKENAFTDEFCDEMISLFEKQNAINQTNVGRMAGGIDLTVKNTTEINLFNHPEQVNDKTFFNIINEHLSNHYLGNLPGRFYFDAPNKVFIGSCKYPVCQIQKYEKNVGHYERWHLEIENLSSSNRVFSMIVYLNDVEEGGETGFLYSESKIKPKKGSLVIFPSSFPFVHCGFKPISHDKYIIATWLIYTS